jgi:hypothetical protein
MPDLVWVEWEGTGVVEWPLVKSEREESGQAMRRAEMSLSLRRAPLVVPRRPRVTWISDSLGGKRDRGGGGCQGGEEREKGMGAKSFMMTVFVLESRV